MSVEDSTFWIMIGTWVSGLGTVGAVITSLYLASNMNKIKLKGKIEIYEYMDTQEPYVKITVSNTGNKIASIKNITWEITKLGMNRKSFSSNTLLNGLPKTLYEGDEHTIIINYCDNNWLSDITKMTNGFDVKKLKLVVGTIDNVFEFSISKDLVDEILQERENLGLSL